MSVAELSANTNAQSKMDSSLFSSLPGTSLRVAEVMPALAREWGTEQAQPEMAVRASQMNLILHLGTAVGEDDARRQWEGAIELAHRYPCRIIILCPDQVVAANVPLQGKLYVGCFVDAEKTEHHCCEVLSLGYPLHGYSSALLENQLSVWKESDLPTYHWFHGMTAEEIGRSWLPLVRNCRRVLFDSSVDEGEFAAIPWPQPQATRDLAEARLLTTRQALGQFLSGYAPALLAGGLESVTVRHCAHRRGEARHLLRWMRQCLEACAEEGGGALSAKFRAEEVDAEEFCLAVEWQYANGAFFRWRHARKGNAAQVETNLGGPVCAHPMRVPFPDLPHALAEALFF